MATPKISDLKTYIGQLIDNTYWNFNFTKVTNWLTDATADLTFNSFTAGSDSSMGNAKITNLGTPTLATDAVNKGYVDISTIPAGYINGFTLTNNATTPNTDIDISAGTCQSSANTQAIIITGTLTKRASTAWSAGTGNGMLDTGSIATSTWYHIFAIAKANGTSDILASTSSANPLLPTGYTVFRRIGSIKTDSSGHIILFSQKGDYFMYNVGIVDVSITTLPTDKTAYTLSVPPSTIAIFSAFLASGLNTGYHPIRFFEASESDVAIGRTNSHLTANTNYANSGKFEISINASSQISLKSNLTIGEVYINTIGYIDMRGKN